MIKRRGRSAIAGAALLSMVAAGCGGDSDPLELGLRRVSLDLAFKDAEKAPPLEPQRVVKIVEYFDEEFADFEEEESVDPPRPRITAPRRPPEPPCLEAAPGDTPDQPVYGVVEEPPKEGSYRRRNTGSIAIETQALPPITLPYPPLTLWDLTDVNTDTGPIVTNPHDDPADLSGQAPQDIPQPDPAVPPVDVTPERVTFTVTRNVSERLKTIDTYMYFGSRGRADLDGESTSSDLDGDGLYLIRREFFSTTFGNSVFTPSPPVMIMPIGDETKTTEANVSAGIDRTTNAAMTVTSRVLGREPVDVCGVVIDAYRVEFEEQMINLSDDVPSASGNLEKPNVWHIAFDNHLLLLKEEVHSVMQTSVEIAGSPVPVIVRFDYTSTLMDPEPSPLVVKEK